MNNRSRTILSFLRWLAGFPVIILVIAFAVANRQDVALNWSPVSTPLVMPFCFFILGALAIGFVSGGFISWLGASSLRKERREQRRRIKNLEQQLKTAANANNVAPQKDFYALPAPAADKQGNGPNG